MLTRSNANGIAVAVAILLVLWLAALASAQSCCPGGNCGQRPAWQPAPIAYTPPVPVTTRGPQTIEQHAQQRADEWQAMQAEQQPRPLGRLVPVTRAVANPSRILLVFGAEWCGPCQAMRPDRLAVLADGWDVRFVDIDQRPDLAGYFGVQSVPCSVVVESAGTQWGVVARVVGRIPRAQLLGLAIVHGVGKRKG